MTKEEILARMRTPVPMAAAEALYEQLRALGYRGEWSFQPVSEEQQEDGRLHYGGAGPRQVLWRAHPDLAPSAWGAGPLPGRPGPMTAIRPAPPGGARREAPPPTRTQPAERPGYHWVEEHWEQGKLVPACWVDVRAYLG